MAQAVFEHLHPQDRYLAESLDDAFCLNIPGASDQLLAEQDQDNDDMDQSFSHNDDGARWRPAAQWAMQAVAALLEYASIADSPAMAFAERFKYVVISSNLLDVSLSPSSAVPYATSMSRYLTPPASPISSTNAATTASSQRPSALEFDLHSPPTSPAEAPEAPTEPQPFWRAFVTSSTTRRNMPVIATVSALALNGYIVLAVLALLFLTTTRTKEREAQAAMRSASYASTLQTLQHLISANDTWNSVVRESIGILEQEERRLFYGPTPVTSPSSSLRVALSSTLLSTQSQTDNVRQLFNPLTSSSQLARFSEMYCPPPPTPKPMLSGTFANHQRPMSVSGARSSKRTSVMATPADVRRTESLRLAEKRMTWSGGSNSSALRRASSLEAGPSTPSPAIPKRKRLSTVMGEDGELTTGEPGPSTAPLQPLPSSPAVALPFPQTSRSLKEDPFTATPPMLRRRRRGSSVSSSSTAPSIHATLATPQPKIPHSRSHNSLSTTKPSPARLALVQTTRHPLSLTALHDQVQAAMASKRFASAHLLALRFGDVGASASASRDGESQQKDELELLDGEDESYWEDVRSVMGLLTSALEDGSMRLVAVLEENSQEKAKDMQPSPLAMAFPHNDHRRESTGASNTSTVKSDLPYLSPGPPSSSNGWSRPASVSIPSTPASSGFAPATSHLTRFANHVNALVDAMDHAKEQLHRCIAVVEARENPLSESAADPPPIESALQSYDRLRKELSTALREFERGRGSLLDLIKHYSPPPAPKDDDDDEEDEIPELANDHSSVEADSEDRNHGQALLPVHTAIYCSASPTMPEMPLIAPAESDLPQHGIEQVFTYDGPPPGLPPPSASTSRKLTREERIALKRSSAQSPVPPKSKSSWGPGGEVVKELKHVILRVEERRKKEASKRYSELGDLATSFSSSGARGTPVILVAAAADSETTQDGDAAGVSPPTSALAPPPGTPYVGMAL